MSSMPASATSRWIASASGPAPTSRTRTRRRRSSSSPAMTSSRVSTPLRGSQRPTLSTVTVPFGPGDGGVPPARVVGSGTM